MSTKMDAASPKTTSEIFCSPDVDMVFLSSDHVTFRLRTIHIISNSSILNDVAVRSSEVIHLPEAADVLEVLFQFIEPPNATRRNRQPSVLNMEINLFFGVAEAAGEYSVYAAMNTCLTHMAMPIVSAYPFQVLNHCAKYGYVDLADEAAEKNLSHSFETAVQKLTASNVLQKWMIYYGKWRKAARESAAIFEETHSLKSPTASDYNRHGSLLVRLYSTVFHIDMLQQQM
ncbi:hypothetical protein BDN70DRAFT_937271 [Pholiota conissans]|uniref:BTB domain-containing protein n=1 Tax=Pholiota conissans TaxID=109636 RepID=A0A9P5YTS6_9AGAR|nr:hypothetical protein BDN70DRAFT_937271 [Pholiota conissans]